MVLRPLTTHPEARLHAACALQRQPGSRTRQCVLSARELRESIGGRTRDTGVTSLDLARMSGYVDSLLPLRYKVFHLLGASWGIRDLL